MAPLWSRASSLLGASLFLLGGSSVEGVWKGNRVGEGSLSNGKKSILSSRQKYFLPLKLRSDYIDLRKERHASLQNTHSQLIAMVEVSEGTSTNHSLGLAEAEDTLNMQQHHKLSLSKKSQFVKNWALEEASKRPNKDNYKKVILRDHVTEFTGEVSVGTPGQPEQCIFDTGSPMAWIMSKKCDTANCKLHSRFDSSKSSTFKDLNKSLHIQFGTGALSGDLGKERITVGGIVLEDQTFGQISETEGSVFMLPFDGICGMSFKMSEYTDTCFLHGIERAADLKEKSFTFYFSDDESAMILGEPHESIRPKNKVEWYPLKKEWYWETELSDVTIGGHSVLPAGGNHTAVFDTGTSVLTMPTVTAGKALSHLQMLNLDCDMVEDGRAPKICYHFKGKRDICIDDWYERGEEACFPSLMTMDLANDSIFILGQPFFDQFVTSFDVGNRRIGVAPLPF